MKYEYINEYKYIKIYNIYNILYYNMYKFINLFCNSHFVCCHLYHSNQKVKS